MNAESATNMKTEDVNGESPVVDAEIIETDEEIKAGDLPMLPIQMVKQFIQNVQVMQQFKIAALAQTEPGDWVRFGDSYHLQADGAQRVARPAGVVWYGNDGPGTHLTEKENRESDGTYAIVIEGFHAIKDRSGKIIYDLPIKGRCYSDDQFLVGKKIGELKKQYSIKKDEPLPEDIEIVIKRRDVVDKAVANFISRGVSILLGIRHPTKELFDMALKYNPRLDPAKIRGVEFLKGEDTQQKRSKRTTDITGIPPEKMNELQETVSEIVHLSGQSEADVLKEITKYYTSYDKLNSKWIDRNIQQAKNWLDKLLNELDEEPAPETK